MSGWLSSMYFLGMRVTFYKTLYSFCFVFYFSFSMASWKGVEGRRFEGRSFDL